MPSKDHKVQLNFSICADLPKESPISCGGVNRKETALYVSPKSKALNDLIPISFDDSFVRSRSQSFDLHFNDADTQHHLQAWLNDLEKGGRKDPLKADIESSSHDTHIDTGFSRPHCLRLSSKRCGNSNQSHFLAMLKELCILRGLHDYVQVESEQLRAEVKIKKEGYDQAVREVRNLQRREWSGDGIRAAALEEG